MNTSQHYTDSQTHSHTHSQIHQQLQCTHTASRRLAAMEVEHINELLLAVAQELLKAAPTILAANADDLAHMDKANPKYDRLLLSEERLQSIAHDMRSVAALPSPLGRTLEERTLPNGLHLKKVSVPLGVVGIIYEARPNVTADVFALCMKSGNACVLKGGSDAQASNTALVSVFRAVLRRFGLPEDWVYLMPSEREATDVLFNAVGLVDVIIPRGSQSLIDAVRMNSKVPVIETGAGIVHTYFDSSGAVDIGRDIIFNAKTRRVSVCNALDTLLVHRVRLADLPVLVERLAEKNVVLFADEAAFSVLSGNSVAAAGSSSASAPYPSHLLARAQPEHFGTEFLDYKLSIKTVDSLDEALEHIAAYSSRHSEAIIAQDESAIEHFLKHVDAAAVYANASTAFTDGAQFGLGAELGISTQKLHARGPMALAEMTSYKWLVRGSGQTRMP
jgi:glutamate-5-semialdehyde dehydrogenase